MTTIVDSNLPVARPSWDHSRLESRIVHLGCGAFHRAHQALYTHHLLESTDSDWGICEVNLMPGNDRVLIENLKKQQLLYTVAEKGAESTELKIIGSMKEALHPEIDGCEGILNAMARPQTAIVSLTVTEKGYCADAASGQLDLNNPLIKHDLENPTAPKSAIGYIVEALRLRREKGLKAFTVMSCDNVRENGHVARSRYWGWLRRVTRSWRHGLKKMSPSRAPWLTASFRRRRQKPYRKLLTSWVFTTRAPLPANRSVSG